MTEKQTHTPGPWTLNKYGEPVDANGDNIRVKGLALTNSDEAQANTRLIAQAPAMLRELEKVRAIISEAALVGFQPLEGDWAERLFLSQAKTARVVEDAGGNAHFRLAATGEAP